MKVAFCLISSAFALNSSRCASVLGPLVELKRATCLMRTNNFSFSRKKLMIHEFKPDKPEGFCEGFASETQSCFSSAVRELHKTFETSWAGFSYNGCKGVGFEYLNTSDLNNIARMNGRHVLVLSSCLVFVMKHLMMHFVFMFLFIVENCLNLSFDWLKSIKTKCSLYKSFLVCEKVETRILIIIYDIFRGIIIVLMQMTICFGVKHVNWLGIMNIGCQGVSASWITPLPASRSSRYFVLHVSSLEGDLFQSAVCDANDFFLFFPDMYVKMSTKLKSTRLRPVIDLTFELGLAQ